MLCHVQKAYLDCAALGPGEACAHQYTFSGSAAPVEVEVDPLGRALVWAAVGGSLGSGGLGLALVILSLGSNWNANARTLTVN
jgi:hypothetical protein